MKSWIVLWNLLFIVNFTFPQSKNYLYISGKGIKVINDFYPYIIAYTTLYDSLSLQEWKPEKALAIALGFEWSSFLSSITQNRYLFLNAYPEILEKHYRRLPQLFHEDTSLKSILVLNQLIITSTKDTTLVTYGNRLVPNTTTNYWITVEFLLYTKEGGVETKQCQYKWSYLRRLTHAPIPEAYKIMWQYILKKCIGRWVKLSDSEADQVNVE